MSKNWVERNRPARLERRFEFSGFEETRDFLDRASELAKSRDSYPDMSFSRTHVSITLYPQDGGESVTDELKQYAVLLDALAQSKVATH